MMKRITIPVLFFIFSFSLNARGKESLDVVVSIPPLRMIIEPILGERGKVIEIVKPGQSPHIFDPGPSTHRAISGARTLFFVADNLDGWTGSLGISNKIELMDLLPAGHKLPAYEMANQRHGDVHAHAHEGYDPHFWTDPLTVNEIIDPVTNVLCKMDEDGCFVYRANARKFKRQNIATHNRIVEMMKPLRGGSIIMFHPSFRYFFQRYGIRLSGVVEIFPGREPGPGTIRQLINTVRRDKVKAICTEPQLPRKPAQVIAESAKLKLFEVDPLGREGESYVNFMMRNARIIEEALR